jgi:hypothetical protein
VNVKDGKGSLISGKTEKVPEVHTKSVAGSLRRSAVHISLGEILKELLHPSLYANRY